MISISPAMFIIYIQFNLIIIALLVYFFFRYQKVKKNYAAEQNLKHDKFSGDSQESTGTSILTKVIDEELILIRDRIVNHLSNTETVKQAYIYELRRVYLNLERDWLNIADKNAEYWDKVFAELDELLRQTIVLFNEQKNQVELDNAKVIRDEDKDNDAVTESTTEIAAETATAPETGDEQNRQSDSNTDTK